MGRTCHDGSTLHGHDRLRKVGRGCDERSDGFSNRIGCPTVSRPRRGRNLHFQASGLTPDRVVREGRRHIVTGWRAHCRNRVDVRCRWKNRAPCGYHFWKDGRPGRAQRCITTFPSRLLGRRHHALRGRSRSRAVSVIATSLQPALTSIADADDASVPTSVPADVAGGSTAVSRGGRSWATTSAVARLLCTSTKASGWAPSPAGSSCLAGLRNNTQHGAAQL